MPFKTPSWVPQLPFEIPDSLTVEKFVFDDGYRPRPIDESSNPFTCGLSGRTYTAREVRQRVDWLARSLSQQFQWESAKGSEWEKIVGLHSLNTIDSMTLAWAIHRLGGICMFIHPTNTEDEVTRQLQAAGCKIVFTCEPLLPICKASATRLQIPPQNIFLLQTALSSPGTPEHLSFDDLVERGQCLDAIEPYQLKKGMGAAQTAYLISSSGTSGNQKIVKVSHRNVIANIVQLYAFELPYKKELALDRCLCILPQSHCSGLILCHTWFFRGDSIYLLPKFDMMQMLKLVQEVKLNRIILIPPILSPLITYPEMFKAFDLSSVKAIVVGALSLDEKLATAFKNQYPDIILQTAYGMTESFTVIAYINPSHNLLGSAGTLIPEIQARLLSEDGKEVAEYNQPGELIVSSPSVVIGYLNNEAADASAFTQDHWLKTGDLVEMRLAPDGTEHLFVIDRLKDVIKVKGIQVAPSELEALLLRHPAVADSAVVAVPDDTFGESPKAFIVRTAGLTEDDDALKDSIHAHIRQHAAQHQWLRGGIEFLDEIPKGGNGKPLRKSLRDST
ncbi:phenylacetyl-CoA ligase [Histoplasma ohiense]|nr:phenylacetyl-CoA ligase [Histoplasma ohiense (nom. inval.)]